MPNTKKSIQKREIEQILAEVIDELYYKTKDDFTDYNTKTHKLGFFKELVKANFHRKLQENENIF